MFLYCVQKGQEVNNKPISQPPLQKKKLSAKRTFPALPLVFNPSRTLKRVLTPLFDSTNCFLGCWVSHCASSESDWERQIQLSQAPGGAVSQEESTGGEVGIPTFCSDSIISPWVGPILLSHSLLLCLLNPLGSNRPPQA